MLSANLTGNSLVTSDWKSLGKWLEKSWLICTGLLLSQLTGHVLGSSDRKGIGTYDWKGLHTTDWKGLGNPLKMELIFVHTEIITITTSLCFICHLSLSLYLFVSPSLPLSRERKRDQESLMKMYLILIKVYQMID